MKGRVVVAREVRERLRKRRRRTVGRGADWGGGGGLDVLLEVRWVRYDSRPEEKAKEPRGRAESERMRRRCREGSEGSLEMDSYEQMLVFAGEGSLFDEAGMDEGMIASSN